MLSHAFRPVRGLLVLTLLSASASVASGEARIRFELVTEAGFPITGARKWTEFFRDAGQNNVRIAAPRAGDQPAVEQQGEGTRASYQVTGVLTAQNQLLLPGVTLRSTDRDKLKKWIERLVEGGEEGLFAPRTVFGLTSKQLVALHAQLSPPLTFSTKGQSANAVVRGIAERLTVQPVIDPDAASALSRAAAISDELKGLSAGTALSAAVRPSGLVLTVIKKAGQPQLAIVDYRKAEETWPVGWPVQGSPRNAIPELFKFLEVEITDIPLSEALNAIQPRLKAPILLDHNALASLQIDPSQARVTVPPGRSYYKRILDPALAQAKLKAEIRVDEAERGFLWVTTIRQPPAAPRPRR